MNVAHEDGSMTIDNASVQRLMDYNLLHYTDEGWFVGRWPRTNRPSEDAPTPSGSDPQEKVGI